MSVEKNTLVIQVQNEVISKGNSEYNHLIDVEVQLVTPNVKDEKIDIKDVIIEDNGKTLILHYIVYDL